MAKVAIMTTTNIFKKIFFKEKNCNAFAETILKSKPLFLFVLSKKNIAYCKFYKVIPNQSMSEAGR